MSTPKEILKQYWGYDGFRPLQEDIINAVLDNSDVLALLPTGGGKSVCYQVPAMIMDGLCLVVSPLIALMQDQVGRLKEMGIPAVSLHSGMPYKEVKQTLEQAMYGDYKMLYISPERLQTSLFRDYLPEFNLSMVAVDEAHCVSQWGHDFRPDYLKVALVREEFPRVPILALTATATIDVQKDIAAQLQLKDLRLFRQSFARNNIYYQVRYSENKNEDTLNELTQSCSIIYCRSRKQTEATGRILEQNDISAAVYHAGMKKEMREASQTAWMSNRAAVMVATTAFGMGIDKPDVRSVLHYDAPEHLEAWYQEAGRAGRDGKPSESLTLFNNIDIRRLQDSVALQFPPEAYLRKVYQSVSEYLQIPIGGEPHRYYPFDISDFSKKFSFQPVEVIHALKLLEREGLWTLTEAVYKPATVQFITSRHVIDEMATSFPKLHYVMVGLLRMYNTIFHFATPVREGAAARQLKVPLEDLLQCLDQLHRMQILEYNKTGEGPQLFFHHRRTDSRHLIIDLNRIHVLRKRHEARTEAMVDFLNNDSICRERYVLTYFGEQPKTDCGHCDVCSRKRGKQTASAILQRQILTTLTADGKTLQDLTALYMPSDKEEVIQLVRKLMDEKLVCIDSKGVITLTQ